MASMTNGTDVRTAAAKFDRRDVADVASAAEDEREQVLSRFPPEAWGELPLERYALGQTASPGSGPTYCRLLEFLTPTLGSIKGGSAAKHIMYHHVSGEWRLAAPLRGMEPQEAWARLRGQFVQAFDAVEAGDFDALDDLEVLRYGPALVTKTLATYFPEHFLPIYAGEHLRRFVALLRGGSVQADAPAWRSNRHLLELVRSEPEFEGWTRYEVMHFLYRHADPRPRQRTIWKIALGERGRLWDECRTDGVIRVGWEQVGDLGLYQSDTDLKQALDACWPGRSGGSLTLTRRLLAFRDLEEGDRIVANRGVDEVLATGTISGNYRFEADRQGFQHTVPVDWDLSHAQRLPEPRQWRSTFAKIDPAFFAKLTAHRTGSDAGTTAQEPQTVPVVLPEDVQVVLDALKRKGQVILHGLPGTGKTRLALVAHVQQRLLGGRRPRRRHRPSPAGQPRSTNSPSTRPQWHIGRHPRPRYRHPHHACASDGVDRLGVALQLNAARSATSSELGPSGPRLPDHSTCQFNR